jgi:hypothetical protein
MLVYIFTTDPQKNKLWPKHNQYNWEKNLECFDYEDAFFCIAVRNNFELIEPDFNYLP